MKAILISDYNSLQNISLHQNVPKPLIDPSVTKKNKDKVLIRTEAVALAPGDVRVYSGKTKEIQGPPSLPYVPGADCCGTIVDLGIREEKGDTNAVSKGKERPLHDTLKVGDRIACRFVDQNYGALGEYAVVSTKMCSIVPDNISSVDAAALASSAASALHLSKRIIGASSVKEHNVERVLILGAGGGVGSHLIQFLQLHNRKLKDNDTCDSTKYYIVGVSGSNVERLKRAPFECDEVLDYNKINPFCVEEWKRDPFDTIVDLGSGGWTSLLENTKQSKHNDIGSIVKCAKDGGKFLTTTVDAPWFELHGILPALKLFLFTPLWRAIHSRTWNRSCLPKFTFAFSLVEDTEQMKEMFRHVSKGDLVACIDKRGPFSFDTDGVRNAFAVQESHHCQGKIVIDMLN